ncbi:hypothetical protein TNCV_1077321 [Trichonephila clavipes]|uniref:Uncharacterized protein n=1 Tax=Trichonephila clavipes TaxID=2585209 RepID=A0A8X6RL36_TRICX|nr:hypothetical protein TNCV_1077321 [Trichonephila clavipes]
MEDTWGLSGDSHLSSPSTNPTRRLAARRLFIVPPCREGTIHLQTSITSPGFELRPYGTAISITNYYNVWATHRFVPNISNLRQNLRKASFLCETQKHAGLTFELFNEAYRIYSCTSQQEGYTISIFFSPSRNDQLT